MTRKESFKIAVEAERRSQLLYDALSKSFSNNETYNAYHELMLLETAHEEKLRNAFAVEFPNDILVIDVITKLNIPGVELNDPKDVLEYAISREDEANAIYTAMAKESSDPATKMMLEQLAREELNHKALLLAEVQRMHGIMKWYDPSELSGLMED